MVLIQTGQLQVHRLKLIIRSWNETRIKFQTKIPQYQEEFGPLTVMNFRISSNPLEMKSFSLSFSLFSYFSLHSSAMCALCTFEPQHIITINMTWNNSFKHGWLPLFFICHSHSKGSCSANAKCQSVTFIPIHDCPDLNVIQYNINVTQI